MTNDNDKGLNLLEIQEMLSNAYQLDLEQGVSWMNDEYSAKWQEQNPLIHDAIMQILDLDACSKGPLQVYHEIDWKSEE
tara:strand:+ start:1338 stop:1574 length:237 start_codon:yes stop_codon:yes gene_type:complete